MRFLIQLLVLVLVCCAQPGLLAAEPDPLREEANRRNDALIQQGYNLTQGWSIGGNESNVVRMDVLIPPPKEAHAFSFWAKSTRGLHYRLLGPEREVLASWSGNAGEVVVEFDAVPGKYSIEMDQAEGTGTGRALLGIRGPSLPECEPATGLPEERAASPDKGFHWPYVLLVPKLGKSKRLLVAPNSTGFATDDIETLRMSAICDVSSQSALAERLGSPLLVPLFPRPAVVGEEDNLYLHALTRASLETRDEPLRRIDLQLLAMIDDARSLLRSRRVDLDERVLLSGFSASGSFVNRFAILHPERVAAVASGSPGGWPIAPVSTEGGQELRYPVGVADLDRLVGRPLDVAALKQVAWFFYLGNQDANDAVPFRDSFSRRDQDLIFGRFGRTPVARWAVAEQLYAKRGLNAHFALYPGVAHAVSPAMHEDIADFFEKFAH